MLTYIQTLTQTHKQKTNRQTDKQNQQTNEKTDKQAKLLNACVVISII